jgi:hypothetical protein
MTDRAPCRGSAKLGRTLKTTRMLAPPPRCQALWAAREAASPQRHRAGKRVVTFWIRWARARQRGRRPYAPSARAQLRPGPMRGGGSGERGRARFAGSDRRRVGWRSRAAGTSSPQRRGCGRGRTLPAAVGIAVFGPRAGLACGGAGAGRDARAPPRRGEHAGTVHVCRRELRASGWPSPPPAQRNRGPTGARGCRSPRPTFSPGAPRATARVNPRRFSAHHSAQAAFRRAPCPRSLRRGGAGAAPARPGARCLPGG